MQQKCEKFANTKLEFSQKCQISPGCDIVHNKTEELYYNIAYEFDPTTPHYSKKTHLKNGYLEKEFEIFQK